MWGGQPPPLKTSLPCQNFHTKAPCFLAPLIWGLTPNFCLVTPQISISQRGPSFTVLPHVDSSCESVLLINTVGNFSRKIRSRVPDFRSTTIRRCLFGAGQFGVDQFGADKFGAVYSVLAIRRCLFGADQLGAVKLNKTLTLRVSFSFTAPNWSAPNLSAPNC